MVSTHARRARAISFFEGGPGIRCWPFCFPFLSLDSWLREQLRWRGQSSANAAREKRERPPHALARLHALSGPERRKEENPNANAMSNCSNRNNSGRIVWLTPQA